MTMFVINSTNLEEYLKIIFNHRLKYSEKYIYMQNISRIIDYCILYRLFTLNIDINILWEMNL
jgi:hypothetical protein